MNRMRGALFAATILMGITAAAASAMHFSPWSTAQKIDEIAGNHAELNTAFLDGCPIQSPDGLSLYMASNRPGGKGGLDMWVATRASTGDPWGAPENLPEPINSAADDFCPTPLHGGQLLFVSRRVVDGRDLRDGRHLLHAPQPGARLERARAPGLRSRRAEQRPGRAGALVHPGAAVLLALQPCLRATRASSSSARSRAT